MGCVIAIVALAVPRLVAALLYLFTTWFRGVFPAPWWGILGFLFLPTSMLWYSAVQHWWGGTWSTWPVVGMVIAVMIDLSQSQGRGRRRES
jgi:hypothetical protein